METKTISLPQTCVMTGKVVSIVVAPPAQMGASLPKTRYMNGAPVSVNNSRNILATRAIVPNSAATTNPDDASFIWVTNTDESE